MSLPGEVFPPDRNAPPVRASQGGLPGEATGGPGDFVIRVTV